jgi:hypothetical protein
MSLQNLELPAELITELYGNHLVEFKATSIDKPETRKEKPVHLLSLGGNEKRITILVAEESQAFMKDEELEWLQKMLQACKLTLGDVAIVNTHSKEFSMPLVRQQLRPEKIVMLGPNPSDLQLPLNFPQFKVQEHDQCTYLFAPSPKELNQETKEGKLLKSKLWVSLQKLFEE